MTKKAKKLSKKDSMIQELSARNCALETALEASYEERGRLIRSGFEAVLKIARSEEQLEEFTDLARGAAAAIQDLGGQVVSGLGKLDAAKSALGGAFDSLGAVRSILSAVDYMRPDDKLARVLDAAAGMLEEAEDVLEEGIIAVASEEVPAEDEFDAEQKTAKIEQ